MDPLLKLLFEILLLIFVERTLVLQILYILHLSVLDVDLVQLGKLFLFLFDGVILVFF